MSGLAASKSQQQGISTLHESLVNYYVCCCTCTGSDRKPANCTWTHGTSTPSGWHKMKNRIINIDKHAGLRTTCSDYGSIATVLMAAMKAWHRVSHTPQQNSSSTCAKWSQVDQDFGATIHLFLQQLTRCIGTPGTTSKQAVVHMYISYHMLQLIHSALFLAHSSFLHSSTVRQ